MEEVVIVSAVRTAIGRMGGSLKSVPPENLATVVMEEVISKTGNLVKDHIDEVILGHAKQSADNPNIARIASLKTGLPIETPSYTVHRQCGSGLQAVLNARHQIQLGLSSIVLSGGVESMSMAPYYIRAARYGAVAGNTLLLDPNTESQPRSQPVDQYGELTMGMTAENLAETYDISRLEQDEFALASQEKALLAIRTNRLNDEIVPVPVHGKKNEVSWFSEDEHPRQTTMEKLTNLQPVFKKDGTVTAGNASGRNDGASALLLMSRSKAEELGLKPLARIISEGVAGVSPDMMGIGPVPASRIALSRAGLTIDDMDLIEINEAFAAQALTVIKELNADMSKVNVNGGAIAFGHPIGNSGSRILVTLLHEMQKRQSRYGLATLCIAGGQGITVIVENIG